MPILKSNPKKHDFYLLRSGKIRGQFRSREHFYSIFERSCFKLSLNGYTSRAVKFEKPSWSKNAVTGNRATFIWRSCLNSMPDFTPCMGNQVSRDNEFILNLEKKKKTDVVLFRYMRYWKDKRCNAETKIFPFWKRVFWTTTWQKKRWYRTNSDKRMDGIDNNVTPLHVKLGIHTTENSMWSDWKKLDKALFARMTEDNSPSRKARHRREDGRS